MSRNSVTAEHSPIEVDNKLYEEIISGRINGPFSFPPFPDFKCSPISLRPKGETGKFRLLHNLSYPYDHNSVNFNIPRDLASVQYATVKDAINVINRFHAPFLAKSDIKHAFRLLPLHPNQYHLTGFCWKGKYYFDRCLPMGCSSACRLFESFSDALLWVLEHKCGTINVVKVLDDFLFVAPSLETCRASLNNFLSLCDFLKIPVASDKTVGPTRCLTFLGFELDTVAMQARLPHIKQSEYLDLVRQSVGKRTIKLVDLQRLLGKLNFASNVIRGGRPFLRRLFSLINPKLKPFHHITFNSTHISDLVTWESFLVQFNFVSIDNSVINKVDFTVASDASAMGYGITMGSRWWQARWPLCWSDLHITIKELFPIVMLISLLHTQIANNNVVWYCDNEAAVCIVNELTSSNPKIMCLVRKLTLTLLLNNIRLTAIHIPGVENILPDLISRFQVTPAILLQYGMSSYPQPTCPNVSPENIFNLSPVRSPVPSPPSQLRLTELNGVR